MFALENPSQKRLIKALEMNDRRLRILEAKGRADPPSSRTGLTWISDSDGVSLLFPRLRAKSADNELKLFLRKIRRVRPRTAVHASVGPGCTPSDIVARLVAFGFEIPQGGGLPGMAARLTRIPSQNSPPGVTIRQTSGSDRTCRLEAYSGGASIGRVFLLCTAGVAGIYDLKVEEEYRLRGIGSLLMGAACRCARKRGFRAAVLTANPLAESLYARFGFREVGRINHCSLPTAALSAPQLTYPQRRIVVAVYMGRLPELESVARADSHKLVTPGGVTLMQTAAAARQVHVGEWLFDRGAAVDPISAWDLGWGDRLLEIARRDPKSLNRKTSGLTPLHQAVLRRDTKVDFDLSLIITLLEAGADPTIEDDNHRSSAIGWAQAFRDAEAVKLLTPQRN